jgi:hypothetical protein
MAIAIIIITTLVFAVIFAYLCVSEHKRDKNPEKWAKFLDDAGVKHD